MALNPANHPGSFGEFGHNLRRRLTRKFIDWHFRRPNVTRGAPALRQGRWMVIKASRDETGHEMALGAGGQGMVHLWCCLDENDRIIDRVIVKNIFPGTETWAMPGMWRDNIIGREPREAWICNKIYKELEAENPGDGRFITRCLGYGGLESPLRYNADGTIDTHPNPVGVPMTALSGKPVTHRIGNYKLYFEYCPHGDLHDQIKAQQELKEVPVPRVRSPGGHMRVQKVRAPDGRLVARTNRTENVPFHEGFVWRMFEAMAKCAVAMERANVLHGDLCLTNVFLGDHDPNRFAIWPTPKLSDFGSSRVIDFMVQNRFAPSEAIQRAFYPPELAQVGHLQYEVDNMQISRKTNIWQIGMLITCMMRIDFYLPECEWRHGQSIIHPDDELHFHDPNRRELQPGRFQHANCNYSAELLALARQCMRFNPNHRPSPRALLRQIQMRIPGRCGGMDTYTGNANGKIPWNKKERLRNVKKDNDWPMNEAAHIVDVF